MERKGGRKGEKHVIYSLADPLLFLPPFSLCFTSSLSLSLPCFPIPPSSPLPSLPWRAVPLPPSKGGNSRPLLWHQHINHVSAFVNGSEGGGGGVGAEANYFTPVYIRLHKKNRYQKTCRSIARVSAENSEGCLIIIIIS